MTARLRLGVVVAHPIQYQVPVFRLLARSSELSLFVYFLTDYGRETSFDPGFDAEVDFGVRLLYGYDHSFLANRSPRPSYDRAWGIINPGLERVLRRDGVDVVLVHGWAHISELLAIALSSLRRIPYMLRGEARVDDEQGGGAVRRALRTSVLRAIVGRAAACLPIGTLNRAFYIRHGAQSPRLFESPYSVDNEWFARKADVGQAGRDTRLAALGLDPTRPLVLFAGKLQPWKRPLDLADAFARMRTPASLVFAGEGPLRSTLEACAAGVPNLRLLGFVNQEELAGWYGVADVLVLPSAREPWGLTVNEAMAGGAVPVVSDRVGCAQDLITQDTGRVFPAGDVEQLAHTLDGLVSAPDLLTALRQGAQHRVKAFSIEATAAGIEKAAIAVVKD